MPDKPPKPSKMQRLVDVASIPFGGPNLWDVLTKKLLFDEDVEFHPKGEREGSVENLIKATGLKYGTLVSPDIPYLEQYFHPQSDVLEKSTTAPGRAGTLPYRKPHYAEWEVPGLYSADTRGLANFGFVNPKTGDTLPQVDKITDRKPGYSHIYDVWDFDSPSGVVKTAVGGDTKLGNLTGTLIKKFLKMSGSPYAIYGSELKE